jgi:hypothetical protein
LFLENFKTNQVFLSDSFDQSVFFLKNDQDYYKNLTNTLNDNELLSSNFIFCRAKNADYNHTANPTIIDSDGNLIYNQLIYSPVTYITAIGLYNDSNELLAVAKLSKPLQKDFTKETLVRVKLDY